MESTGLEEFLRTDLWTESQAEFTDFKVSASGLPFPTIRVALIPFWRMPLYQNLSSLQYLLLEGFIRNWNSFLGEMWTEGLNQCPSCNAPISTLWLGETRGFGNLQIGSSRLYLRNTQLFGFKTKISTYQQLDKLFNLFKYFIFLSLSSLVWKTGIVIVLCSKVCG